MPTNARRRTLERTANGKLARVLFAAGADFRKGRVRTARFRSAFLAEGSETLDNLQAMKWIEWGPLPDEFGTGRKEFGLRTKRSKVALSALMWRWEEAELPRRLQERYPRLTQAEWSAFTRVMTMLIAATEVELRSEWIRPTKDSQKRKPRASLVRRPPRQAVLEKA